MLQLVLSIQNYNKVYRVAKRYVPAVRKTYRWCSHLTNACEVAPATAVGFVATAGGHADQWFSPLCVLHV